MTRILLALVLATAAAAAAPHDGTDWRRVASEADRNRLRDWRTAWVAALGQARAAGGGAAIDSDPALFDPDAGLPGNLPAGDYRCRRVDVGNARPPGGWASCTVTGAGAPYGFAAPGGIDGRIYGDGGRRSVFLGGAAFGDERRPPRYGHAAGRNVVGIVQRIGDGRWRLALPYPPFGGALGLIEIAAD